MRVIADATPSDDSNHTQDHSHRPLVTFTWGCAPARARKNDPHPLAIPDLSSPRATLTNFLALMNGAYFHWKTEGRTYQNRVQRAAITTPGTSVLRSERHCAVGPEQCWTRDGRVHEGGAGNVLKLPSWAEIPERGNDRCPSRADQPDGRSPIPRSTLVRLKEGLHEGEWVFNSESDERAQEFYERVKHLPYTAGRQRRTVELFVSEPGWMIPRSGVHALPGMDAGALRMPGGLAMVRAGAHPGFHGRTHGSHLPPHGALVQGPSRCRLLSGDGVPDFRCDPSQWATDFLSDQVLSQADYSPRSISRWTLVSLAALVVVIMGVTNRLATAMMALPWFKPRQLNAHLAQLIVRTVGVAASVVAVFEGGRYLGVPLTTLVAGVSVSGLTVALAAQDTLKNLFGSLMILLDRPFQVGDLIRIKGHEGKVESVGLRSTRIRDANGHVVSISNEEMARLDSKNISSRSHLRRQEILRLRADTPAVNIRSFVEFVRGILENHEGFDPKFPPSVQIGFQRRCGDGHHHLLLSSADIRRLRRIQ